MKLLLHYLGNNEIHLRSLALVQMKLNFPLDDLALLLRNSIALQDLDISNNDCLPIHFAPVLKELAHNKLLHSLNLSWNTLIDRHD